MKQQIDPAAIQAAEEAEKWHREHPNTTPEEIVKDGIGLVIVICGIIVLALLAVAIFSLGYWLGGLHIVKG